MEDDNYVLPQNIVDLGKELMMLFEVRCKQLVPEVSYIINRKVKNIRLIEETLDQLLDIPTDKAYYLFERLCEYYKTIDPEAAKFYMDSYVEIYGEPEPKVRKKTISDDDL